MNDKKWSSKNMVTIYAKVPNISLLKQRHKDDGVYRTDFIGRIYEYLDSKNKLKVEQDYSSDFSSWDAKVVSIHQDYYSKIDNLVNLQGANKSNKFNNLVYSMYKQGLLNN